MPNEKPILFSGPMIRAILENRKTQTRRVMRKQPIVALRMGRVPQFRSTGYPLDSRGYSPEQLAGFCPYGKPGERLWVRETLWVSECGKYFARQAGQNCHQVDVFEAKPAGKVWPQREYDGNEYPHEQEIGGWGNESHKREGAFRMSFADCDPSIKINPGTGNAIIKNYEALFLKKRSAIHMPRWASRITLEITNVRVERLQEIGEADCIAEGVQVPVTTKDCPPGKARILTQLTGPGPRGTFAPCTYLPKGDEPIEAYSRAHFASAWDVLNAKRKGCAWRDNPFVWVIEFRRL